jgi:hypothetical protein
VLASSPENGKAHSTSQGTTKRRASSVSDSAAKRPRLSPEACGDSPSTLRNSPPASNPDAATESQSKQASASERRNSHVQEERKRGKRLFGGLLNTLAQGNSASQIKKRQEIEKRQQERAARQREEDDGRKAEKLAKLKEIRIQETAKFHEQSVSLSGL